MEEIKPRQLFEGVSPDVSAALQEYIEADTPTFYIRQKYYRNQSREVFNRADSIDKRTDIGIAVGLGAVGVAVLDSAATFSDKGSLNVDEYRDAAEVEMDAWINGIEDDIGRSPDEIIVPRSEYLGNGAFSNETQEVYDVTTQAGLGRFVEDQIVASPLDLGQKEALLQAVDMSGDQRTTETDHEQIIALYDATDAHVETYPDREQVTTNAHTGELFWGGSLLFLASIVIGTVMTLRQDKQIGRYRRAKDVLCELYYGASLPRSTRDKLFGQRNWYLDDTDQPAGGGLKKRKAVIESVQKALLKQDEKVEVA